MKSTVKTAISIDVATFRKVERLTKKLHISRSRFFTEAARYMIEHDENLLLLERINASYSADTEEAARRAAEKEYVRGKAAEEW